MTKTTDSYQGWITFKDAGQMKQGIVNGEPFGVDSFIYVPVHVPATNKNMVVNSRNIVDGESA